jgi:hypothetical protein
MTEPLSEDLLVPFLKGQFEVACDTTYSLIGEGFLTIGTCRVGNNSALRVFPNILNGFQACGCLLINAKFVFALLCGIGFLASLAADRS